MKKHLLDLYISALICGLSIFMMSSSVYADPVENIRVIKISPQDERAVIKTSGRRLQIIKVGDVVRVASYGFRVPGERPTKERVAGYELRVIEITNGRVVFEGMTNEGLETLIIRVEDGEQQVERIRKMAEEQPLLSAPMHKGAQRENKFKKSGLSHE